MKQLNWWLPLAALLITFTSCNDTNKPIKTLKQTDFPAPPIAEVRPDTFVNFGQTRIDNYFWLKDKNDPKVIDYLQAENRYTDTVMASTKELQETIIANMFDEFTRKRQDKIAEKLRLDKKTMDEVMAELLKLNPRPGSALGETIGSSRQHIVPDFIVDCYNDDEISFTLNSSNIPTLRVNREYSDMLDNQIKSGKSNQRDAAIYLKRKLDAARGFIQALKQREQTLTSTMRAIIEKQRTFFLEGDESQLKPMVLKDIAEMTGYDISTISRSTSGKYVQTCFGTFPLKFFFTDGVRKKSGEKVSVKKIHSIIRDLIANEDQASPLTDEELASMLLERGFKIARRTVAKYREQIGIPVARLRKR